MQFSYVESNWIYSSSEFLLPLANLVLDNIN